MKNRIVERKKGLQNKWQNFRADFKLFCKEVNKHYKRINDEL
jgi:hypothetical protein